MLGGVHLVDESTTRSYPVDNIKSEMFLVDFKPAHYALDVFDNFVLEYEHLKTRRLVCAGDSKVAEDITAGKCSSQQRGRYFQTRLGIDTFTVGQGCIGINGQVIVFAHLR